MIPVEAGIVVGKKLGHKVGVEFFLGFGVGFFVGDVVDLVRVFFEVVKFESRTWAEAEIPVVFVSRVFAVLKHPGAGGAGIDIAVGYPGVFSDDLPAGWIVGIERERDSLRCAVGSEVDDEEVVGGADGPAGIGKLGGAGAINVCFASDKSPAAEFVGISRLEGGEEALSVGSCFGWETGCGEESGGEIDERDRAGDYLTGFDVSRPTGGEKNARAEVVEVGFSSGESGRTVVTGNDHKGVVELA